MNNSNRRTLLKAAGTGAAVAGVVALTPSSTSAAGEKTAATPDLKLPSAATGSLVAYIHDVSTGEVSVMVEGREVTVTDHQMVAKLARAIHSSIEQA